MKSKDKKLTSVRVSPKLFSKFKLQCLEDNFSFQKLAERSLFLYLTDTDFKDKLNTTNISSKVIDEE